MRVTYEGIGHMSVTFPTTGCQVGYPCKPDANGNAVDCGAGEKFMGVTESAEAMCAGVQIGGFVTLPYSGTKPTPGYVGLSANGTGGVKVDSTGSCYWVVAVDDQTLTFKL